MVYVKKSPLLLKNVILIFLFFFFLIVGWVYYAMITAHNRNIKVSCGEFLKDLELTLTPFTIIVGAAQTRKATFLKSLYFAVALHVHRQPNYVFTTLFPGLQGVRLSVKINDYYIEFYEEKVKMEGEPPWRYAVYVMPDHSTIIRMMLEAAEFVEEFKQQHDAITMLGGLASVLATLAERYGRYTFLSRLALCACDVFIQAGLNEMCRSWKQALNNVFFGLGARALTTITGLSLADTTLSDYDIYKKFVEAILTKSRNNTVILVENISYYVKLKNIQDLIRSRIARGENVAVVASITFPPGIAKSLESGEISRSRFIDSFQAVFEVDLDPSISSLYLFKRWRGEGRIVAERLFP